MTPSPQPSPRSTSRTTAMGRIEELHRMLFPRSVAVIGASRNPASIGGRLFRNILEGGYTGRLYPVNPATNAVEGIPCYSSLSAVPEAVDLAIIVVPAQRVLDVVDACAAKGVHAVLLISSGFGEIAGEGRERQRLLREKLLAHGIRLIGPNCLGLVNTHPDVALNATFASAMPPAGAVSMATQSGALGLALLDRARMLNLGVAQFVSFGNRVDVSPNDLLEQWERDASTRLIVLYLESFGNPRNFSRIARRVSRAKPIIAIKSGRSPAGQRAALSHTGSLAGTDAAVDALFRQAGVIRVNSIAELFVTARLLAHQPPPRGNRIAIVTNAGGPGIMAADACDGRGLEVPTLSDETQQRLRAFLPGEASVVNPVDIIASATPDHYRRTLAAILDDPGIDAAIVIHIPVMESRAQDMADAVRETLASRSVDKPVAACFIVAQRAPADLQVSLDRLIPAYTFPEDAVTALAHAWSYGQHRLEPAGVVPKLSGLDPRGARAFLRRILAQHGEGWLLPDEALHLLRLYGIPIAPTAVAASPHEAAAQAASLRLPVAMKLRSRTVTHKSDVGGVALGVRSATAAAAAYRAIARRMREAGREREMEGVIIQPMAQPGQEMILGMTLDPDLGPLMMAGLGGIHVEIMKDAAFSLHPLTDSDPTRMLRQLKGYPLLTGYRDSPPLDITAVCDTLLRLSALAHDLHQVTQMEINPLIVYPAGQGAIAVDARILARAAAASLH